MEHQEDGVCECAVCKEGIEVVLEKERAAMEDVGWYAHYVGDDPDHPYNTNYHTHGLPESFGHLDMQICMPLDMNTAHHIMSNAVANIKKGNVYEHGETYGQLIEAADGISEYKVLMLEAEECERKVLRMIIPDKHGRFDGDLIVQKRGCKDSDVLHD